jgi:uncharacterized protein (DUF1330 family)
MAAYVVAQMAVHDLDMYRQYAVAVMPTVGPFGGRLVAANDVQAVEGSPEVPRAVIGEFPTMEQARAWYDSPEYQAVKHLRTNSTTSVGFVVEGLAMPEQAHKARGAIGS